MVILLFSFGIYAECRVYALAQRRDYEFTWERFLYGVIAKNLDETGAYWYLYAYFGFLCLLPFMQKMSKQMSRSDFYTLLVLHFALWSVNPICNLCLRLAGRECFPWRGSFLFRLPRQRHFFIRLWAII